MIPSESRLPATATPAAGRGSRQMLKLQRYTGTDSLETFLCKFHSMSRYLQWNEDDAMYHLCGSLERAAGQVLKGLSTSATTTDVIQLLQTRFGTKLQVERFKAELLTRRRQPDETLQHVYREISRLVSLVYPSKDTDFTDHVGKEAFIRALDNGPLQLEVIKGEPTNLESALNFATKYEAYKCSLVSQGTLSKSFAHMSISDDDDRPKRRLRLMSAPILVPPRHVGKYVLDMDASDTALGAVLQQEHDGQLRVIGYASRALTNAKRRYCITRKELLGIVYGLKKYRQYLLGQEIVVRTDHAALTFLKKTPEPIGQQGRWLDLLSEYIIEIQHRPGRAHSNSDALSRRPCERSGGKECQQCLRTIAGSQAAQARNAEASATGQV